ncbi:hypothetical protein PG985_007410 [Apiospora marii]|uniref:Uncharacterized protein n=1 Tax=Apiospora marii TaxID=335849 RepID=A0ABR1SNN3_9PEZI
MHKSPARSPDSQPYLCPAKTFAGPHHPRKPGAFGFWTYIGNSCPLSKHEIWSFLLITNLHRKLHQVVHDESQVEKEAR